jgi:preprotein translocase subunit SecE
VEAGPGKHRLIANVVLVAVWAYVAMIYLLALDQQFRWGIF